MSVNGDNQLLPTSQLPPRLGKYKCFNCSMFLNTFGTVTVNSGQNRKSNVYKHLKFPMDDGKLIMAMQLLRDKNLKLLRL